MPFKLVRNDITQMNVDAIVNAANSDLLNGGGVCGAIFRAAGAKQMTQACAPLAPILTSHAVITPGFRLPARYVIHAAGPVYSYQNREACEKLLYMTYWNSLHLAQQYGIRSIAFPLISSGIYGYPKAEALEVATWAIKDFLEVSDLDVYLAVFDRQSFEESQILMDDVQSYIDDHYVSDSIIPRRHASAVLAAPRHAVQEQFDIGFPMSSENIPEPLDLKSVCSEASSLDFEIHEPFNESLFNLIDEKGMSDAEVYKKANLDRRLFSKIRSNKNYLPSKKTILSLSVALGLDLSQTNWLLEKAGYTLSRSLLFDVIVEYFISIREYDIFRINEVLFQYDQSLLGSL